MGGWGSAVRIGSPRFSSRSLGIVMQEHKILFLYLSVKSGHQKAADALQETMHSSFPLINTLGVDTINYAYPLIGRFATRAYLEMLKKIPQIWDYLYDNPDVVEATQEIRDLFSNLNSMKLKKLIKTFHPDAIVCTHAVPCSVVATHKRKKKLKLPLIAVITDYAAHAYWLYDEVDKYFVPSQEVKNHLMRNRIPAHKIEVSGIPVSPQFYHPLDKFKARKKLHIDPNIPTVLIMGGSQGLGPIESILYVLQQLPIQIQVIVIAGFNKRLKKNLKKMSKKIHIPTTILGYTEKTHTIMSGVDIIISKAGGLTSTECLATGLPMIIFNPIPGQEARNTKYLVKKGIAVKSDTLENLGQTVYKLLNNRTQLERMHERARKLWQPHANEKIAEYVKDSVMKQQKKFAA